MKDNLLKAAILEAKAVKEKSIADRRALLEEAFADQIERIKASDNKGVI